MHNLTEEEESILKSLNSPRKIQDFLNSLKINFEENGDTCMSPRKVLQEKKCHCIEGAMLAALALHFQNQKPLNVDLTASKKDFDHVIAIFKENNKWGAISKTNHAVLRFREPIYNSIRELVMTYFHEYTNDSGEKTLRSYSLPVNLLRFGTNWITSEKDVWEIPEYLTEVNHFKIIENNQILKLRKADELEIQAGLLVEWKAKNNMDKNNKKVFVSGCFDLFHSGHLFFLETAASYGDLYVSIGSDKTIKELKNKEAIFNENERQHIVKALKCVKEAFIAKGRGILDFESELRQIKPDIFIVNKDGDNELKIKLCEELNIQYIVLERTPYPEFKARSSTNIKKEVNFKEIEKQED